jgi:hypothetical protein
MLIQTKTINTNFHWIYITWTYPQIPEQKHTKNHSPIAGSLNSRTNPDNLFLLPVQELQVTD